jgi:hypothetical protein
MSRTSDRACARAIACERAARPRAARPARLSRGALVACMLVAIAGSARAADECGAALKAVHPSIAQGDGARIAFVPRSLPVPVGRHFDIDFVICGVAIRDGAAVAVDADMPAHRHGMNYRTRVEALPGGVFRAHGLMFHMPGTWRVIFDVPLEGRTLRLTRELEVQ